MMVSSHVYGGCYLTDMEKRVLYRMKNTGDGELLCGRYFGINIINRTKVLLIER